MDNPVEHSTTTPLSESQAPKRPYAAPLLRVHGTVAELTAKIGNTPDFQSGGSFNPPPG